MVDILASPRGSGLVVETIGTACVSRAEPGFHPRDTRYPVEPRFRCASQRDPPVSLAPGWTLPQGTRDVSQSSSTGRGSGACIAGSPRSGRAPALAPLAGYYTQGGCFWGHFVALISPLLKKNKKIIIISNGHKKEY